MDVTSTPTPPVPKLDWDMTDWSATDITVAAIFDSVGGCGDDEDQVAVVTATGQPVKLLGIRRAGKRVEIVVEAC